MSIPELPPPTLRLRIDQSAIADNWRALNRLSGKAQAAAAVKADAYGLGVDHVLPALLNAGAREFFVAHWGEVPAVLRYAPPDAVSVLHGISTPKEAAFAIATGVRPVINSLHQAQLWKEAGGGICHVMVDSGMNRLGIASAEVADPLIQSLSVDVLMSHLASAEEDSPKSAQQLAIFQQASKAVSANRLSLANSAGIALGNAYHFALTRPGLALYGGVPCEGLAQHVGQVAHVEAAVLQVRDLNPGDAVGYNATWTAKSATRVATVSIGYADGLLRCWAGAGIALHHQGNDLPILGRVSMDMIVVDCSNYPAVKSGEFVEVPYDLPTVSAATGLSQYELLTILGNRFGR